MTPPAGRRVLITRPEPDARETAARVAALGYMPVLAPSLRIEPRALLVPPGARFQSILVTSASAIASLPGRLHAVPLLAVGNATAARARGAGFWRVSSAGRDARALASLVALCCATDGDPLLLVCGQGQAMRLAVDLRARGFRVVRRVVYAARRQPELPPDAMAALEAGTVSAALFFSAETARAFAATLARRYRPEIVAGVTAVAISHGTADALAPLPWGGIRVASRPNQDELLACLT